MKTEELRNRVVDCSRNRAGKRIFPRELREEIVRCAQQSSRSLVSFCQDVDINVATVNTWLKADLMKNKNRGSFKKIKISEDSKPRTNQSELTLTSPAGFSLHGSSEAIISVWRSIDASAT